MGRRLPSSREDGQSGQPGKRVSRLSFQQGTPSPGALPGRSAFQSRIWTQSGPDGMQLLLSDTEYVSQKSHFPKIQGARLMKKILLTVVLGVVVGAVARTAAQPAQGQWSAASPRHKRPRRPRRSLRRQ